MEHIQGEGSEVSSLADVSPSTLSNVKLSTESTVMKRLFKEYLAVRKLPVLNVAVAPLPNNFMEWHGNLLGPAETCYEGGVFHFSITFEADHPRRPPKVTMLTRIEHPCVHNGLVSLDFLTEQEKGGGKGNRVTVGATNRYKFWSPGYTVMSILVQLQAFLFEGTAEIALESLQDVSEYTERRKKWESGVQFSVEQSLRYSCTSCKHRPRKYWPPLSNEPAGLPVTAEEQLFEENATCFFTQKTHSEAALGLGISFQKDVRTGRIQNVRCVPDVISLNAFKGYNVKEAWGQAFSHWMPLFLQKSGADRSLHLAQRSLSAIYAGNPNEFQPFMALDFYPRLMTHLAVSFAQSDEGGDAIRALRAYAYLHRLFLEFLQKNPSLITSARDIVQGFLDDPSKRTMEACNAIGLLVIYVGFTGHTWAELAPAYLGEAFDRNAQRVIKKYPELDSTEPNPRIDATRVSKSFTASSGSGWKFLMAQLLFNRIFVSPSGSSIPFLCNQYDKCWSLLPPATEELLLKEKKSIVAVNSFSSLYENIGVPYPGDEKMIDVLRQSVINSRKKRYHGDKGIEVLSPEEFEKQRLGSIKPLEELVVTGSLHDDEKEWKALCENRFGLTELPSFYTSISQPWKKLYVQYNLQELVSKLNDNPDFKLFYHTLELSKGVVTRFELVTFLPDNIKSQYFFLSRILEQLPHLTHLVITKGEASLGHKGFKELVKGMAKGSGSLQVLDMRYLDISEAHVSKLAESHLTSEGLTCLNLEGNSLESEGSTKLAQLMVKHRSLPNLSELNLKACKITDEGMKALAEGLLVKRNIRRLNLSKNPAGANGLARILEVLAYSPCIEELVLTDISGYSSSSSHLQTSLGKLFQLTVTLKTLNFWKTPIADAFNVANTKQLADNETITTLGLGSTNFSSSTLNHFATVLCSKKSKLQELELDKNALSLTGCADINEQAKGKSSSLTKLSLASGSSIFSLVDLANAKTFGNMVTFFTKTLGNLTVLDVSRCNLSSSGAELFGNVLSKNTLLKELNISFNNIGKHGARFIATGLASNSTLEVLRLDKNSLGAAGAHYLASLLEKPTCLLRELYLFCNHIDVPGTIAMCKALQTNKHLCVLDLGLNRARKRGAAAVCEMLAVNTTLTTLSLKFNYIPDPLAIKIVKQIAEAPHCMVSTVKLAGNSLQYDTLVTVVTTLKSCVRAVTFDLAARAEYKAPERMERTIYLSPLAANVTPDMVKKLFYSKKCGAIKSVKIDVHKKKKAAFAKANYALVEFAHKDSVELAIDLVKRKEAHIGTNQPLITRAGLSTKTAAEAAGRAVGELV